MMAAAMQQQQQQQQQQHPPGGSIVDVAREKDEGALRALCQVCSASGEVGEARKACVLVTIYRRESDLFALLLRERRDSPSSSSAAAAAAGRGGGKAASAGLTVLCDMSLDDGVHLEMQSAPLVVKVVNTCGQRIAYLLEFGRAMDLATFQRAFTSARGYFRQMLTLRTLVADSFWQGFASGAEAPVRTEPHGPPDEALKPPPGVVPGQPEAGLRGKSEGPGALGLDSETLAAQIVDLCASGEGGSAAGSGAATSRVRSPGGAKFSSSSSSSRGGRAGGGSGNKGTAAAAAAVTKWPGAPVPAGAAGAAQRKANKEYNNRFLVMDKSMSCHRCHRSRPGHHFVCPNNNTHVNCVLCLTKHFPVQWEELQHGIKRYYCPQCQWGCSCSRCDNKQSRGGSNEHNGGAKVARADTSSPLNQYLPAPQLTHYEGLFAKYLQSLPALERVSTTEDVCFLCKEGGNLVECDEGTSWSRRVKLKLESLGKPPPAPGTAFSCCGVSMEEPSNSSEAKGKAAEEGATGGASKAAAKPTRCKKVYHAYCMGFNVGDDELSSCPRHSCVECGEGAGYFCRFCPVSLCGTHFRTDPSGMIAETYESLKHRVRRPFPRTRGGGFGPRSRTQAGGTGTVAGASSSSSSGGGAGSRGGRGKRGRPGRGRRGRGGGRWSVGEAGGEATIAQRRPKRGQTATVAVPVPVLAPAVVSVSGGGGGGDRRSCGVGLPGGGAGFGEHDFVCTGCKMAAKRAVRQYGLLGSLETGGVVLPHGESEGSGDESESDILPVTALPPRDSGAAASGCGAGDGTGDAGGGQEDLVSAPGGAGLAGEPEGGHNIGDAAVGGGAVVAGAAAAVSNATAAAAVAANNAAAAVAAEKYFSMFSRRDPPATPEVTTNGGDAGGGTAGGGGGDGDVEMG